MTTKSWVSIPLDSPFPLQNLPYGAFRLPSGEVHLGVAIGEEILDLSALESAGVLASNYFGEPTLNRFLAAGRQIWSSTRQRLRQLLVDEPPRPEFLVRQSEVQLLLPVQVGDYTDFYSSREHATNVGTMLRGPENALMPNWLYLPVAYHGRASSVVVSGTDIHRPIGQSRPENSSEPIFGPSKSLDFELEMGAIVGVGNPLGQPIPIDRAEEHLFGLVLVNDWSARDIQAWEYQPLGPFLAKNFATSISPWVVPLEALEPFRCPGPKQDPQPLPYLRQQGNTTFDIHLEVRLNDTVICRSNFRHLYWSLRQQVAHHTSNGCPLRPGDLLASGTISGPTPDSYGCLLELTWRGTKPLTLADGQLRRFLENGDRVTMTAWCQGEGFRLGFGEVTGVVVGS